MIENLYAKMEIPDSCLLGKRVYKKLFLENGKLNPTDKKALSDDVDTILWQYTFKPSTIPIQSYEDERCEYHEVALLQVNLTNTNRANRLAEILHRSIPYPLIIVFVLNDTFSISLAYKRFSQAEKDALVAETFQATEWLDISDLSKMQTAFLDSLNISTWPHSHFLDFYTAIMERVIALACAEHNGCYALEGTNGRNTEGRLEKLKQLDKLQQETSEIRGKLKKEKNIGTQVQLNTRIREIGISIETIKGEL